MTVILVIRDTVSKVETVKQQEVCLNNFILKWYKLITLSFLVSLQQKR